MSYDTDYIGRYGYFEQIIWELGKGDFHLARKKLKESLLAVYPIADVSDTIPIQGTTYGMGAYLFDIPSVVFPNFEFEDYGDGRISQIDLNQMGTPYATQGYYPYDTPEHLADYWAGKEVAVNQTGNMIPPVETEALVGQHALKLRSEGLTDGELSRPLIEQTQTLQSLRTDIYNEFSGKLPQTIHEQFLSEKGQNVSIVNIKVIVAFKKREVVLHPYGVTEMVKCHIEYACDVCSDTPFSESPLDPVTASLITKMLVSVILAILIPILIFNWLNNMTVKRTTWEEWDWVLNPNTGEWEWKMVASGSKSEPDIGGIAGVGTILIVLVVVVLLVLGLGGRYKKG